LLLYLNLILETLKKNREGKGSKMSEYTASETAGRQKLNIFPVSFPLVGNPSDLFGSARKILDKPE